LLAGSGPAASNFLLLRQKKVTKEKATLVAASLRFAAGNLWCSSQAGSKTTRFAQTRFCPDPLVSALLGPARTGQSGAGIEDKETKTNTNKDTP
jgi:hypothetical protein